MYMYLKCMAKTMQAPRPNCYAPFRVLLKNSFISYLCSCKIFGAKTTQICQSNQKALNRSIGPANRSGWR